MTRQCSCSRLLVRSLAVLGAIVACHDTSPLQPHSAPVATNPLLQAAYLDISRCATSAGGFTTTFTHPYFFPPTVGFRSTLEGDDKGEAVRLQITVLNAFRNVGGVSTRVIEEREWIDGTLVEVSWNYYAQSSDGSVCYFGEDVDIYQNGAIVHDGAWCTGGINKAGIFLPVELQPGTRYQMESAPNIAVDEGRIVGIGPTTVPFATYAATLRIREFNPLDGDVGFKTFATGVGLIEDGPVKLTAVTQTSGTPDTPTISVQSCGS